MLKELLAIWRNRDPVREMYQDLLIMIGKGERMFEAAWGEAAAGRVRPEVKADVLRTDIEVNKSERAIRKRLVEHLVVQPGTDVPASLILMSVVKDAERVGDYCKDILDAAAMETKPLSESALFEEFKGTYESIHALFGKTRRALAESNRTLGEEVMVADREIGRHCDAILAALAAEEMPCRVGVPWALLARYLKRMVAHLSNMASSLVMPLHKLDYHDEEWLGQKGKP